MGKVEAYSDFWKKKVKEYGLGDGLSAIIDILKKLDCNDYFELGIGTGWPIANSLLDEHKNVYGCDISSNSVLEAVNDYPQLFGKVYAGSIEEYSKLNKPQFDCVYCIRSSWYMKDFPRTELMSMLKMTKPGGYLVFNIINSQSSQIKSSVKTIINRAINIFIHRCICALKVLILDEDYSGQMKLYFYTDNEIRENLRGTEITAVSLNQLEDGMDKEFDPNSQKILYIARKQH